MTNNEKGQKIKRGKIKGYLLPLILSFILVILLLYSYDLFMEDKFYPFTFIGDTRISFLTLDQAINIYSDKIGQRSKQILEFHHGQNLHALDLKNISLKTDHSILKEEFEKTHPKSKVEGLKIQLQTLLSKKFVDIKDIIQIDPQVELIAASVFTPAKNAQLIFSDTKTLAGSSSADIQIIKEVNGVELDKTMLKNELEHYLITGKYKNSLPLKTIVPKISSNYIQKLKNILEDSYKNPTYLKFAEFEYPLDTKQLLAFLDLENADAILNREKTYPYLGRIAQEIDREVVEGKFEFNPTTKRVDEFKPSLEGRKLDIDKTFEVMFQMLNNLTASPKIITLPVNIVEPKIKTSQINDLGIKELLGTGVSHFKGSIENRIYNIKLAASRINGVLIPPGEVFSFNEMVGDISAGSGYKPAYVIKSGRTVLDDGGGVCQVSTTVFRAVLYSGLSVVQRVAHAYRVGYYEQGFLPGLDATVFAPSVDFKFKNDTANHILLQSYTLGNSLYVDIYGTPDGRFTDMTKPTVANVTAPPPDLRQDDPTMPKGEVKQVDWPAWGATVSFNRTVKRGGEILSEETFRSNFKAWQAVYLVGTREN